jgi:hypothetical protein
MHPPSSALPPKCHYVLSLHPVYRYLQQMFRPRGVHDDAFAASVLQGVAMTVLNMGRDWVDTPPLDDLYSRVSEGAQMSMQEAASLCREVDTQIGGIVFHHLPDLNRQDLLQLDSYEFIHDHDLRLVLQYKIPLLPAPQASPSGDAGVGLPRGV